MPRPAPWPAYDAEHLLVDSATMARLEEVLFASGLPVEALMEKAALAVSRRLLQAKPEQALVLVGPGHNGGDGLVVARELHLAGIPVRIWSPFARHKPLTEGHLRYARWLGIPLLETAPDPDDGALWVDALFGIGQNRPPTAVIEALLAEREGQRPGRLVSIDVPTGLCADSGRLLGRCAARAQRTWCLGLLKRGLLQNGALRWVGELERLELGLPASLLATLPPETPRVLRPADRNDAPWPPGDPAASKYERGRLLVVAGSRRYRGAALLALRGASAAGCGSLRAAVPDEVAQGIWNMHPEVVLEPSPGCSAEGTLALAELADDWLARLDAVLVGPGLGAAATASRGESERWRQLRDFGGLLVLDADGLNRLAQAPEPGLDPGEWLASRGGPTWITPHAAEFSRLFPTWAELPPLEAAAAAAEASRATVLLKGARSVVASPDGRRWQLGQAGAAVARAGLGDVLAGYAAGMGAYALACGGGKLGGESALLAAAALDHAIAGQEVCDGPGPAGTTPGAVAEALARRRKS